MTTLRKLTLKTPTTSFLGGVLRGAASSVEVFETPKLAIKGKAYWGLKLDIEALRKDVGKAKTKLAREIQGSSTSAG